MDQLRRRLAFSNSLERERNGQRLLCLFPHLEIGGSDKFNLDLLGLLSAQGYDITIATTLPLAHHPWHQHFYKITADIFHLGNYLFDAHWLACLHYLIESRRIDVVFISHSSMAYYLLPLLRDAHREVAFVDYVHMYDPGHKFDGYPRLSRQFNEFLDAQMVSCQHLADYNQELEPATRDKTRVCYINVDANAWQPDAAARRRVRAELKIDERTALLLFPARLEPQKRPQFIVEIARELVARALPVAIVVLGAGSLREALRARISELGLDQFFHLLPPVGPERMKDYYSAADVLLLPTEYEGISLAVYEAMAMELAVVASDVGGQRELVVEGTGYLLPKGLGDEAEAVEYAGVLEQLIRDEELRKEIGRTARRRVKESFTLEAMCERARAIMAEAIGSRRERPEVELNARLAEESLMLALECYRLEEACQLLARDREVLSGIKAGMEASKFWKLRDEWFRLKSKFRRGPIQS